MFTLKHLNNKYFHSFLVGCTGIVKTIALQEARTGEIIGHICAASKLAIRCTSVAHVTSKIGVHVYAVYVYACCPWFVLANVVS